MFAHSDLISFPSADLLGWIKAAGESMAKRRAHVARMRRFAQFERQEFFDLGKGGVFSRRDITGTDNGMEIPRERLPSLLQQFRADRRYFEELRETGISEVKVPRRVVFDAANDFAYRQSNRPWLRRSNGKISIYGHDGRLGKIYFVTNRRASIPTLLERYAQIIDELTKANQPRMAPFPQPPNRGEPDCVAGLAYPSNP